MGESAKAGPGGCSPAREEERADLRKPILYAIAFLSGAVVLSLEIMASRILQPRFGNTVFVWGSLISIFLAGLSTGYFLGGHLADRRRSFLAFGILLLLSALLLLTLPLYAFSVCEAIFNSLGIARVERLGPLLASLSLFFIPTAVLGTTSPYAVKLLSDDPERLGRQVGTLYAVSTIGSIVGTLGTTFFLILWMGTRQALFLLGALQVFQAVVAFAYWAASRRAVEKDLGR